MSAEIAQASPGNGAKPMGQQSVKNAGKDAYTTVIVGCREHPGIRLNAETAKLTIVALRKMYEKKKKSSCPFECKFIKRKGFVVVSKVPVAIVNWVENKVPYLRPWRSVRLHVYKTLKETFHRAEFFYSGLIKDCYKRSPVRIVNHLLKDNDLPTFTWKPFKLTKIQGMSKTEFTFFVDDDTSQAIEKLNRQLVCGNEVISLQKINLPKMGNYNVKDGDYDTMDDLNALIDEESDDNETQNQSSGSCIDNIDGSNSCTNTPEGVDFSDDSNNPDDMSDNSDSNMIDNVDGTDGDANCFELMDANTESTAENRCYIVREEHPETRLNAEAAELIISAIKEKFIMQNQSDPPFECEFIERAGFVVVSKLPDPYVRWLNRTVARSKVCPGGRLSMLKKPPKAFSDAQFYYSGIFDDCHGSMAVPLKIIKKLKLANKWPKFKWKIHKLTKLQGPLRQVEFSFFVDKVGEKVIETQKRELAFRKGVVHLQKINFSNSLDNVQLTEDETSQIPSGASRHKKRKLGNSKTEPKHMNGPNSAGNFGRGYSSGPSNYGRTNNSGRSNFAFGGPNFSNDNFNGVNCFGEGGGNFANGNWRNFGGRSSFGDSSFPSNANYSDGRNFSGGYSFGPNRVGRTNFSDGNSGGSNFATGPNYPRNSGDNFGGSNRFGGSNAPRGSDGGHWNGNNNFGGGNMNQFFSRRW